MWRNPPTNWHEALARWRPWVLVAPTLLFGLVYPKLVCVGYGVATGHTSEAVAAVDMVWLRSEWGMNLLDLLPFAAVAGITVATRSRASPPVRWGAITGAWGGALGAFVVFSYGWWQGHFKSPNYGLLGIIAAFAPPILALPAMAITGGGGALIGSFLDRTLGPSQSSRNPQNSPS